ncbi:MAG: CCC motif membrane protein [Bacteroidales bacterium]|nr:CCC motif membrane protein [Bacteroidales bacterium]
MNQDQKEPTFNPSDPFNQKGNPEQQYGEPFQQQPPIDQGSGGIHFQQNLPNSTGVLVLGILSIVGCFCYGIVGLILGIIALIMSSQAKRVYDANPKAYLPSSYNNLKAGNICAIIGVVLSALYIVFVILYITWIVNFIDSEVPFPFM